MLLSIHIHVCVHYLECIYTTSSIGHFLWQMSMCPLILYRQWSLTPCLVAGKCWDGWKKERGREGERERGRGSKKARVRRKERDWSWSHGGIFCLHSFNLTVRATYTGRGLSGTIGGSAMSRPETGLTSLSLFSFFPDISYNITENIAGSSSRRLTVGDERSVATTRTLRFSNQQTAIDTVTVYADVSGC